MNNWSIFKPYFFVGSALLFSIAILGQQPKLVLPVGHTSFVKSAKFSPDGKRIVTASIDNTAKIWDVNTGYLLADLKKHTGEVHSAEYSTDGKKIVTASWDSTAKIWDAGTGFLLADLKGHTGLVYSARFSPDGKKIITISSDNTAKVWSIFDGTILFEFRGEPGYRIESALFSTDGKKILTISNNRIKVWDALNGTLLGNSDFKSLTKLGSDGNIIISSEGKNLNKIFGVSLSRLSRNLYGDAYLLDRFNGKENKIITFSDSTVKVWDMKTGNLSTFFQADYSIIYAESSHDGKKVVTTSWDSVANIWDAQTGKLIASLKGHDSKNVDYAEFSPDGSKVVTASTDKTVRVWNVKTGKLLVTLEGHSISFNDARLSPDGKAIAVTTDSTVAVYDIASQIAVQIFKSPRYKKIRTGYGYFTRSVKYSNDGGKIIAAASDLTAKIWNVINNSHLVTLNGHSNFIISAQFSPDGKKAVTASTDNTAKIWDAETGELLINLKGHRHAVVFANFSPDGKKVITASYDNTACVWDAVTGELLIDLKGHKGFVNCAQFSPDGEKAVTVSHDKTAKIWDVATGTVVNDLKGHNRLVIYCEFSPDGGKVVTVSHDGVAMIWDSGTGQLLMELKEHRGFLNCAQFNIDGKLVLTGSNDNTCKIWNTENGRLLYTFINMRNTDNILVTPLGYYFCSFTATKLLHYVTKDLKVISFEQLDVKYNRPDKVLEAIGNTDTALIKSYRKAWEKRIKKLGIDTTAFRDGYSVPEADFANRDDIDYEQKSGTLKLHIKATDSTYQLDRFNIWVNEAPLYGQRGISIKNKKTNGIDTTITINLSQGENRIETSITNVNGTESYRMPLQVNYTPAVKQKEMTRFIGIGIDKFSESQYNLDYSSKDIRDLAKKLKEKYKDNIVIDTLFNENVTVSNVKALKQTLQQTSVNDKVIISYSGHGLLSKDYDYYLSTYAVNFQNPEENGLAYDELENLLDSIPARKKLMLIDACHSGEVDKEEGIAMNKIADSLGLSKGIIIDDSTTQTQQLGLKNSFELMQSLFVNVGKSTGATIISAAAGNQFALERGDLKNGVFTYSILEAMEKNPTMKISELKKIVGERVEQLTNGMQKPTSRNETIAVDWSLW